MEKKSKPIVFLCEEIDEAAYKKLSEKCQVVNSLDQISEIQAIITRKFEVGRDIISKAKNLKIISNHGTGSDQIDFEAAKEFNIPVKSTPGLNARSVAELALSFILSLSFKVKDANEGILSGKYKKFGNKELQGSEVFGKKLGVIGTGNIAQELSKMMKISFGAECYAWNPRRSAEEIASLGFTKVDSVTELCKICDFVSIHIPITSDTKNLVNWEVLKDANPDLILVNTARGGIINEADLYKALTEHKIKAAGLDVFKQDPPDAANPQTRALIELPNVIATLHVGGSTKEALQRVGNACVQNVFDVLFS